MLTILLEYLNAAILHLSVLVLLCNFMAFTHLVLNYMSIGISVMVSLCTQQFQVIPICCLSCTHDKQSIFSI